MTEAVGGLLIVAHAPLATALREVALHAFAECATEVLALDIAPERTLDQACSELRAALDSQQGQPVLVLVDVLGATPGNALQAVLSEYPNARAAAGVNLPMLWRSLCYRGDALDQWQERALVGGARGVQALPTSPAS